MTIDPSLVNLKHLKRFPEVKDKFVWRADWGADEPKAREQLKLPVEGVLLTYTETKPCKTNEACIRTVKQLQQDQMAAGMDDIQWNFLVGSNGMIYEGRGWDVLPVKSPKYAKWDGRTFDIAYIANKKRQVNEDMKFIKGQLIRFALWELLIKDDFKFVEDKVDRNKIKQKMREAEEKKRKLKEMKAKKKLEKIKKKEKEEKEKWTKEEEEYDEG
ncbi:peptidoglycan recognition protein 1-like [Macrosteles quadrilineatus]|uniref:peptidoglycan recognition protein 1-like n=1 Tax=Macrosteles quadrilineatus TaxID=74068 RepID=UPI0023E13A17|nr:peptidoglycan recognition protein 1-like [Macrosteles quadrilineatus]